MWGSAHCPIEHRTWADEGSPRDVRRGAVSPEKFRLDDPLDAFIGANTLEITVTGSTSALPRLSGRLDKDWTPPTP